MLPRPPTPPLFPYTTLFRSQFDRIAVAGTSVVDALMRWFVCKPGANYRMAASIALPMEDRKSTRLNSSHVANSYAVFCLKKKMDGDPAAVRLDDPPRDRQAQ